MTTELGARDVISLYNENKQQPKKNAKWKYSRKQEYSYQFAMNEMPQHSM